MSNQEVVLAEDKSLQESSNHMHFRSNVDIGIEILKRCDSIEALILKGERVVIGMKPN